MKLFPTVLPLLLFAGLAPGAIDSTEMRRLTHSQYNHTVHDLLGDQTNPANQFPQEDFVTGFKNQPSSQSVPPLLAEACSAAAEKMARILEGVGGAEFSSPKELVRILASRPECREWLVRQLFRYGGGRHELGRDGSVIQAALTRFRDSQFRFKELMISLATAYALGN